MQTFRSVVYTCLLFLTVPPWAVTVLLLSPFGRKATYRVVRNWIDVVLWLL